MKILTDYQERPVRLTDERWLHIIQHPEMADLEDTLAEALAQPELVTAYLTDKPKQVEQLWPKP